MSILDDLSEIEKARLRLEWATVVALRGTLDIALRRETATTCRQAINFGEVIVPSLLAKENRILLGARESNDARLYGELALAESARTGIAITRDAYIKRAIDRLRDGIATASIELSLSEGELERLQRAQLEITPKKHSENKLILRDAKDVERNLALRGREPFYNSRTMKRCPYSARSSAGIATRSGDQRRASPAEGSRGMGSRVLTLPPVERAWYAFR